SSDRRPPAASDGDPPASGRCGLLVTLGAAGATHRVYGAREPPPLASRARRRVLLSNLEAAMYRFVVAACRPGARAWIILAVWSWILASGCRVDREREI